MKKGLNQWSLPDKMSLRECMELAKDAGFDGLELALVEAPLAESEGAGGSGEHLAFPLAYLGFHPYRNDEFTLQTTPEQLQAIKAMAEKIGIEIPSVTSILPFLYPLTDANPETRRKGVEIIRTCVEFAAILGAGAVLTIPAVVTPGVTYDQALAQAHSSLMEVVPLAQERQVTLAVENVWNRALLSPIEFRDFIDGFNSPAVGAYFDVGNVLLTGLGEQWIRILGQRIKRVHFDNFRGEVGNITGFTRHLLDGDVNWPAIMQALRDIHYNGWVTAEITPPAPYYPEKVIYDIASTMDWIIAGGQPA